MIRKYRKWIVLVILVVLLIFCIVLLVLGSNVPAYLTKKHYFSKEYNTIVLKYESTSGSEPNFITKFFYITSPEEFFSLINFSRIQEELLVNPIKIENPADHPISYLDSINPNKVRENADKFFDFMLTQKHVLKTLFFVIVPTISILITSKIAWILLSNKVKNKIKFTKKQRPATS